jgi:hypothetical protein
MTIRVRATGTVYEHASYLGVSWARVWVGATDQPGGGWLHFRTDEFTVLPQHQQ